MLQFNYCFAFRRRLNLYVHARLIVATMECGQLGGRKPGLKPRSHQQKYRSNIVECYESNDSFDKVECCFDKVERCFDIVADVDGLKV